MMSSNRVAQKMVKISQYSCLSSGQALCTSRWLWLNGLRTRMTVNFRPETIIPNNHLKRKLLLHRIQSLSSRWLGLQIGTTQRTIILSNHPRRNLAAGSNWGGCTNVSYLLQKPFRVEVITATFTSKFTYSELCHFSRHSTGS